MAEMFDAVVAFFRELGWPATQVDNQSLLRIGDYAGTNGRFTCFAQVLEEQAQFIYYSICPMVIPAAKRAAAGEFVNRANYGLILGNFELDYEDGELRYKTSASGDGAPLTARLLLQLVQVNVVAMDRYLPGLMSVIYADSSPANAVAAVEASEKPELAAPAPSPAPPTG